MGTRLREQGAHPRSRGENRCVWRRLSNDVGLIPARAGKTAARQRPWFAPGAHPRSRGENFTPRLEQGQDLGPSPLARGKRIVARFHGIDSGLIPARAGKTSQSLLPPFLTPAHPRSRGENDAAAKDPAKVRGSSPLARGKLA